MGLHRIFITVVERSHVARQTPKMAWFLIVFMVAVYLLQILGIGMEDSVRYLAFVPGHPTFATVFASMFLHGGLLHLAGNTFFLWMYGDNIEEKLGPWAFLGVFLFTGLAATFTHWAAEPGSLVPSLGASGAVSGLMGFYGVIFPKATLMVFLIPPIGRRRRGLPLGQWPASYAVAAWLGAQLIAGLIGLSKGSAGFLGIAVWAHIGGAVAGMALAFTFMLWGVTEQDHLAGVYKEPPKKKLAEKASRKKKA